MKKLLLPLLLLLAAPAYAQNPGTFMPSCRAAFTFSATGRGPVITQPAGNVTGFNNITPTGSVNTHCAGWTLSYAAIGFSAVSIEVDTAPDASTTTVGTTPGSWTIWPSNQIAAGQSLPLTSTTGAAATVFGFFPWVSINVTTATCPAATTCQGVAFLYGWQVQGSQESNTGATQVVSAYNRTPITTSTNTQIKATSGIVHTLTITQPGATANSITLVDTSVAACTGGTTIMTIPTAQLPTALAPVTLTIDATFNSGICVTTAGTTAPQLVVTWR